MYLKLWLCRWTKCHYLDKYFLTNFQPCEKNLWVSDFFTISKIFIADAHFLGYKHSHYFRQRYYLHIKDKKQPLLISNTTSQNHVSLFVQNLSKCSNTNIDGVCYGILRSEDLGQIFFLSLDSTSRRFLVIPRNVFFHC